MIGKIDQGQVNPMADDLHADDHYCHPKPQRPSPPAVRFHLEKTSIFLYEAYEGEGDDDEFSFSYFSSRSEEVSFKTTTDRGIMACRQELVDAGEDIFELSNAIQRRHGRIKGVSDIEHLISSVSIRKKLVSQTSLLPVAVTCLKIGLKTNVYIVCGCSRCNTVGTDIGKEASHSGSTR